MTISIDSPQFFRNLYIRNSKNTLKGTRLFFNTYRDIGLILKRWSSLIKRMISYNHRRRNSQAMNCSQDVFEPFLKFTSLVSFSANWPGPDNIAWNLKKIGILPIYLCKSVFFLFSCFLSKRINSFKMLEFSLLVWEEENNRPICNVTLV